MVNRNEYIMVSLVYKGHQYYKSFGAVFIVIRLSCSLLIRTILSLLLKTKINTDETVLVFSKTTRNRMTMTKKTSQMFHLRATQYTQNLQQKYLT